MNLRPAWLVSVAMQARHDLCRPRLTPFTSQLMPFTSQLMPPTTQPGTFHNSTWHIFDAPASDTQALVITNDSATGRSGESAGQDVALEQCRSATIQPSHVPSSLLLRDPCIITLCNRITALAVVWLM